MCRGRGSPGSTRQHGEHHVITAVGGGGERESQSGDQQRLRHAEPVIAPTRFAVVVGHTEAGKSLVVLVDKLLLDRRAQLWPEAGCGEVGEITCGQPYPKRLPIHHRDPAGVRIKQHVVEAVVTVQQGKPILLGKQPGLYQTHCGDEGLAVGFGHAITELVQSDVGAQPCHLAETFGRCFVGSGEGNSCEIKPDRITPAGPVQAGHRDDGQPCLLLAAARDLVALHRGRLIGQQQRIVKSVVADLAVEALRRRYPYPVRDRVVEGTFTAIADGHPITHGVVLSRQFDHKGIRQPTRIARVARRHPIRRAGLPGADGDHVHCGHLHRGLAAAQHSREPLGGDVVRVSGNGHSDACALRVTPILGRSRPTDPTTVCHTACAATRPNGDCHKCPHVISGRLKLRNDGRGVL